MRALTISAIAAAICMPLSLAQTGRQTSTTTSSAQESFATPDAAAQALLRSAQAGDAAALNRIFGRNSAQVISSGDPVQDRNTRAKFVQAAEASMKVNKDPRNDNRAFLLIGPDDFQFPIPLVRVNGRWRFDTQAGQREILARRIGSNELDAIAVCREYVEAQQQYAAGNSDNKGVHQYARKFISSPGLKDGLYWPAASGATESAISARVSRAAAQGYQAQPGRMVPYHGYYFKILSAQGPDAPGGARNYLVQDLMIGGFGLVAWPAEYGNSGVMTFMVNQDGMVYQKNLGPNTSTIAQAMAAYNPDKTWRTVR
jgi:hypothetical protein